MRTHKEVTTQRRSQSEMTTQRPSIFHPYTLEDKDSINLHRIFKNFLCKYAFVFYKHLYQIARSLIDS